MRLNILITTLERWRAPDHQQDPSFYYGQSQNLSNRSGRAGVRGFCGEGRFENRLGSHVK
jgi:hypothetical protein